MASDNKREFRRLMSQLNARGSNGDVASEAKVLRQLYRTVSHSAIDDDATDDDAMGLASIIKRGDHEEAIQNAMCLIQEGGYVPLMKRWPSVYVRKMINIFCLDSECCVAALDQGLLHDLLIRILQSTGNNKKFALQCLRDILDCTRVRLEYMRRRAEKELVPVVEMHGRFAKWNFPQAYEQAVQVLLQVVRTKADTNLRSELVDSTMLEWLQEILICPPGLLRSNQMTLETLQTVRWLMQEPWNLMSCEDFCKDEMARTIDTCASLFASDATVVNACREIYQVLSGDVDALWQQQHTQENQEPRVFHMNNQCYTIQATRVALDGRNMLLQGSKKSIFGGKPVMIKIYRNETQPRGVNEAKMLFELMNKKCSDSVVVSEDFSEHAVYNDRDCVALVMELGGKNLKQLVEESDPRQIRDLMVSTMKKIAKCLYALHYEARVVHGDLKLENVVNFGDGPYPDFKLIDFENSCRLNSVISMDCTPEYCPPELAARLVGRDQVQLSATSSFDVWSFGVLWIKYLCRGKVLIEFQDLDRVQILRKIADPSFDFHQTLSKLTISRTVKQLIQKCTCHDPTQRLTLVEILKDPVIKGVNTTLWTATIMHQQMEQQLRENHAKMVDLVQQQQKLIWQQDKFSLPCFWVIVPWHDSNNNLTDHQSIFTASGMLDHLCTQDVELRLLCDAALDEKRGHDHGSTPCSECPQQHRIRIRGVPEFVTKALPVLRCVAVLLKIARVANFVIQIPGFSDMTNAIAKSIGVSNAFDWTCNVLKQSMGDNDQIMEKTSDFVEELEKMAEKTDFEHQTDIRKSISGMLRDHSLAVRAYFETGEKQQAMLDLLTMADSTKKWTELPIIGGLQKIRDKSNNIRWVCAHHAKVLAIPCNPDTSCNPRLTSALSA